MIPICVREKTNLIRQSKDSPALVRGGRWKQPHTHSEECSSACNLWCYLTSMRLKNVKIPILKLCLQKKLNLFETAGWFAPLRRGFTGTWGRLVLSSSALFTNCAQEMKFTHIGGRKHTLSQGERVWLGGWVCMGMVCGYEWVWLSWSRMVSSK